MMETDPPSLIGRAMNAGTRRGFGFSQNAGPRGHGTDIQPVLMWLAGAGYRPREAARDKGMRPMAKGTEEAADRILAVVKPDEPVFASRMRADMLVDLFRDARHDPRTGDIFEADRILVADPRTGWLVTESMLATRIGLFDSLNALLEKPYLTDEACADMRQTLIDAFGFLSPDSQREWCYSEFRLEQGIAFLERRQPSELLDLAAELRPVSDRRGIWDAVRLFSIAAQMGDVSGADAVPVADLLAMDDGRG